MVFMKFKLNLPVIFIIMNVINNPTHATPRVIDRTKLCDAALNNPAKTGELVLSNAKPTPTPMMLELYGAGMATNVAQRLNDLDRDFGELVGTIAYDIFWARPGLSTRDKSLVTVASLIALNKEEQIRIHMNGFLNAGGTKEALAATLMQLALTVDTSVTSNAQAVLRDVLASRSVDVTIVDTISHELIDYSATQDTHSSSTNMAILNTEHLSRRDLLLILVSAAVAIGNQNRTVETMQYYFSMGGQIDDLKNALIHQIVYCGFPAAMNGFAALKATTQR